MPLILPQLDDRQFQDIVDEAKSRITYYCPEWTDHNVSDPGVTLIELFAWMTDLLLYRLNQVPRLHYLTFMQMLGITLDPPEPARAAVTFWLSKAQPSVRLQLEKPMTVRIPGGTAVATTQTETEPSIVYSTNQSAEVQAPHLTALLAYITRTDGQHFDYVTLNLATLGLDRRDHLIFARSDEVKPAVGSALYFGFETDLSQHVLRLELNMREAGGANVKPDYPPYVWEAATGKAAPNDWAPCVVAEDSTLALCRAGVVVLHLPTLAKSTIEGKNLYWVRVRLRTITPEEIALGVQPYLQSPRIINVVNEQTLGLTLPVRQAQLIQDEYLGRSDGHANQRFQLQSVPVLPRTQGETLLVAENGQAPQPWEEVRDFASSGMDDKHYMLDSVSGEVRLGPAIRQRDGTIKLYGAIPPRGATLTFRQYRSGGGHAGNVASGAIDTLKSSIPFIESIENLAPASGGMDAETLESAMLKASALLRTRERAITADDFEFIARDVLHRKIARVKCIQPRSEDSEEIAPNLVYILVIAHVDYPELRLQERQLHVRNEDMEELAMRLEERRPLTMRVRVLAPEYTWVAVQIRVTVTFDTERDSVERTLLERLYRFINPIIGGEDGKGWPFGRTVFEADIVRQLPAIPGVLIRGVEMYEADREGNPQGARRESIRLVRHGVAASGLHSVVFVAPEQ
ncbi:MAG: putative baseplate assembly protein [Caldilineaceae bacterium]